MANIPEQTAKILKKIGKEIPTPKPKLEQPIADLTESELNTLDKAQQKTFLESEKVQTKLDEHTPVLYQYIEPTDPAAVQFYKLNEQKRDLYNKMLRLKKEKEHVTKIQEIQSQGGSARDYIKDILSKEMGVGKAFTNIEARTNTITNKLNAMMHDARVNLRTTWGGLGYKEQRELGYDLVRYLKDGVVKNEANLAKVKQMADGWKKTTDTIKRLRNQNGGRVGTLEDWVMPQSHDKRKMVKEGKERWKASIVTKLDVERIEKEQGANIDKILDSAWDNITKRTIETAPKGVKKQLAKKHEFERVLHFRTGDDMVEYNKQFGNEDVLSIFDTHVRTQANEIAQLQILGTNPELTYENLKMFARNEGMGARSEAMLDALWNVSTGKADAENIISQLDTTLANVSEGYRSLQIASKLGGATLSSIADVANIIMSSGYRNLNSINIFGKGVGTMLEEATTMGVGNKTQLAARIGVVSEFANASLTNSRFSEAGSGWLQRRAENVLRFSGLTAWTNSLRTGFGLEMSANIAEAFGRSYDQLPFKKMFEEYGITADDWARLQQVELENVNGAKFININKMPDDLSYKIGDMLNSEMDAMIVSPGYRTRTFTTWGAEKGTLTGETARNLTLFKSFPITIMMVHFNRMGQLTNEGRLAYASGVLFTGVVFGTISLWAKDIAKGETPRDLGRASMVPEALVQSGGLGIIGDLFLDENARRYGTTWWTIVGGVPASTLKDVGESAGDIIKSTFGDQDFKKTTGNIYNRAAGYIPGQNLWQTRLLLKDTLGEFVGEIVDPDYHKKKRRYKKALRTRGQELIFD